MNIYIILIALEKIYFQYYKVRCLEIVGNTTCFIWEDKKKKEGIALEIQAQGQHCFLLFFSPIIVFDWRACGTISILFVHSRSHAHTWPPQAFSPEPVLAPPHRPKTQRKLEALCRCSQWTLFLFFSSSFPPSPVLSLSLPTSARLREFDPGPGWWSGVSKWNIDPLLRGLAFTLSCALSYRLFRSACNRNYYRRPGRVITWHGGEGAKEGPSYISSKEVIYRTCYLQPSSAPSLPSDRPSYCSHVFLNLNSVRLTVINHTRRHGKFISQLRGREANWGTTRAVFAEMSGIPSCF